MLKVEATSDAPLLGHELCPQLILLKDIQDLLHIDSDIIIQYSILKFFLLK